MKKSWILAGTGLTLIVLVLVLTLGPLVVGKAKNTFSPILNPTSSPTVLSDKYNPPKEVVSGSISLTIVSPADGSTVSSSQVTVSGKTSPNAEVAVNDQDIVADANGNFSVNLTLDEGENPITVSANDQDGNYAEKDITVIYEPSQ